jgi:hypothetical protein
MITKFIGISRVSTQRQMNNGNSVFLQCESIKNYALQNNGELVEIVKVQASGKKQNLNVGQLAETIKKAKKIGASLIVTKVDRLSRDQITLLMLRKASLESNVEVHVTSMNRKLSDISDLEFTLLASMAQEERKLIVSRCRESAKGRIGAIGTTLDPVEMGKRSVNVRSKISRDWAESVNLRHHIEDAINKLKQPTQDSICQMLNGQNILTIRGAKWNRVNLLQQINRLGWSWKELKAG